MMVIGVRRRMSKSLARRLVLGECLNRARAQGGARVGSHTRCLITLALALTILKNLTLKRTGVYVAVCPNL